MMYEIKKSMAKLHVYLLLFLVSIIGYAEVFSSTEERSKLIEYNETIGSVGDISAYINEVAGVVAGSEDNYGIPIFSKDEKNVVIGSGVTAAISNYIRSSITRAGNNFTSSKTESQSDNGFLGGIINDTIYSSPPKNPTPILPIGEIGGSIKTTDTKPFFVSYFENGDHTQGDGFTRVEIWKDSGEYLRTFFMGQARKGSTHQLSVKNKSYTYGFIQDQTYTGFFLPGGSLDLGKIEITGYPELAKGRYKIYMQNQNKFGMLSEKIYAGSIEIVDDNKLIQFDPVKAGSTTREWSEIIEGKANLPFRDNVQVIINNPSNLDFDVVSTNKYSINKAESADCPATEIGYSMFCIDEMDEGVSVFTLLVRDEARNVAQTKTFSITIDSMPPSIVFAGVNSNDFLLTQTDDNAKALAVWNGVANVNDKIQGIGQFDIPIVVDTRDNNPLSGGYVEYSKSISGPFRKLENQTVRQIAENWEFKGQMDWSDTTEDGMTTGYIRIVDSFGNKSSPKAISAYINRSEKMPEIVTNGGSNVFTDFDNISISVVVDPDTAELYVNGSSVFFTPFTRNPSININLTEGKNIIQVSAVDILGNRSANALINITRGIRSGQNGIDKTIRFQGGVHANELNLQRNAGTENPGEIFTE